MAIRRQAAVPRWAIATLGGVTVATALIALFTLALGFDLGVAAVLGGGLGTRHRAVRGAPVCCGDGGHGRT